MDLDLARLENILSPYLILRKKTEVVYVSSPLAKKTGFVKEEIQDFLKTNNAIFDSADNTSQVVKLPMKDSQVFSCTFTNTKINDAEIIAFSESVLPDSGHRDDVIPEILITMAGYSPGACLIMEKGHVIHANSTFCNLLGFTARDIIGSQIVGLISRQCRGEFVSACNKALTDPERIIPPSEIILNSNQGKRIFVSMIGGWVNHNGTDYLWMIINDTTESIQLKKRFKEEEQKFSDLFDLSPIGLLYVNPRGIIVNCNEFVCRLMGYAKDEIFGEPFTKFVAPHEEERLRTEFKKLFCEGKELHRLECMLRTKDGEDVTIECNVQVIARKQRNVQALMVFSDVTDKKELEMELLEKNSEMEKTLWEMAEVKDALEARAGELNRATEELKVLNEKLNQLSITDGLTEIYNHRHFQDRLSEEVERAQRAKGGVVSLLILDIDDFKHFNDTYGHQCGDMVLKQLAGILRSSVRNVDILARYGGEEFAVILPSSQVEEAAMVAERICESVRSTPFSLGDGTSVKVTVSIGVGCLTHGQGEKSELIRKADNALYAAKAKWKDRVEVWEED